MENVLVAVGFVLLFAYLTHRGLDWLDRELEAGCERQFPSRARAWEDSGRAQAQDALRFGPRSYTDEQTAFIDAVVRTRQPLPERPVEIEE